MPYPKSGGTQVVRFANDAQGRRTDTWLQANPDRTAWAAHTSQAYDPSGRVTRVVSETGPATNPTKVLDQRVCYAAGATAPSCPTGTTVDRSKIRWVTDAVTAETSTYSYDGRGRLVKVVITGGMNPRTYDYTYDSAGNRLTAKVNGTAPSNQALSFNNADQIASTGYGYDGAGNLTRTAAGFGFGYNTAGQRTAATSPGGTPTSYTYAGTSQAELLTQATTGANTYRYVYGRADSSGQPVIETASLTNSGGTTVQAYVAHDPAGQPVLIQTSTGTVAMYVYDARRNPVGLITDAAAVAYTYDFDPYGTAGLVRNSGGSGTPQNPYLYAGGLQDRDTGLVRFGARWYNPSTGTWTSRDTLDTPLDPDNANRYLYAGGDPINNTDTGGRLSNSDVGGVAGGAVGSLIGTIVGGGVGGFVGGIVGGLYGADIHENPDRYSAPDQPELPYGAGA